MEHDIRWEQRFSNYRKAVEKLGQAVKFIKDKFAEEKVIDRPASVLDEVLKEGLIQRFEYTHELAWNVMKDYAEYQGDASIRGSRDATREAFKMSLVNNGEVWMDMIKSRNETSHTYNEETAEEIFLKIIEEYYPAFDEFTKVMRNLQSREQADIFEIE
ncbi:MAG TPA: nucleotidyltransferase substrate binding protein [Prolixibacteraceae bacterium]|jgi:nucleotidyltransferase substrate binding protein (TIGR01987 family)